MVFVKWYYKIPATCYNNVAYTQVEQKAEQEEEDGHWDNDYSVAFNILITF